MTRIINPTIFGGTSGQTLLGGEVAGWCATFTDDATDWIGSNDGTFGGGMGTVADTDAGGTRAYEFDGTGDSISMNSPFSGDTGSISLWVKAVTWTNSTYAGVFSRRYASDYFELYREGSNLSYRYGDLNSNKTTLAQPSTGSWVHVVLTYDNAVGTDAFYDDVDVGGHTGTWTAATEGGPMTIGKLATYHFEGRIDNFRVYDRVLTSGEISSLYDSGNGRGF